MSNTIYFLLQMSYQMESRMTEYMLNNGFNDPSYIDNPTASSGWSNLFVQVLWQIIPIYCFAVLFPLYMWFGNYNTTTKQCSIYRSLIRYKTGSFYVNCFAFYLTPFVSLILDVIILNKITVSSFCDRI